MSKLFVGIDNGVTGAIAALAPDDTVQFFPVAVQDLGKGGRLLDIAGNADIFAKLIDFDSKWQTHHIVYEQGQKQPIFGCKGNYANGQNNEFWRVFLTLKKYTFSPINPKMWQKHILANIRGDDTKAQAALVIQQRFPKLDLSSLRKDQRMGVVDALCIALWAREVLR